MPGLVRKLIIVAAVEGLILFPYGNSNSGSGSNNTSSNGKTDSWPLCINYKTNQITQLTTNAPDAIERKDIGLESYGLAGLLSVASYSYLISITQRRQVAQIQGKPVYVVTNVALIPISSQNEANRAISQAREYLRKADTGTGTAAEDIASEDETDGGDDGDDGGAEVPSAPTSPGREVPLQQEARNRSSSSIAEDVIGKKVSFGRTAASWLSRRALGFPGLNRGGQDRGSAPVLTESNNNNDTSNATAKAPQCPDEASQVNNETAEATVEEEDAEVEPNEIGSTRADRTVVLLPKLLRYTKLLFSSQNFFFSYDYDLTRQIGVNEVPRPPLPLHKVVDPQYFWNRHLLTPLIESGTAHNYVLPLIQGFVGQREFTVAAPKPESAPPDKLSHGPADGQMLGEKQEAQNIDSDVSKRDYLLTLISRRSVKRPGLRYLRRGVDDEGNTANFVETEQILSVPDWDPSRNVYSYLQIRGSIPLYFSQSPYALKPTPVFHQSAETNQLAFERHFRELSRRYGQIQAVSLVDKHAGELKIGEQYEKYAERLNDSGGIDGRPLKLVWFDFHNECRGMKFENVRRLVDSLKETLEDFGGTVINGNQVVKTQTGIVRTNCMDCLDRTGVAQCAFGAWALARELKSEGLEIDLHRDSSTQWFNTIWADNGDAISKQYSSTAALKGDYTRTRKRNYRGALNDFGLTLSRYYNNIVNDYFSQACIDYLLGNVSTRIFTEFETAMQTADPGISVQKLRQSAIDTSCKIVISDPSEEFLGGWTMLTPRQPNTLRTLPFEESVLLLTDAAVYSCRFDWTTDKVLSFERIDLRSISRINYGTYITSILTDAQSDETANVGLVILYRDGGENALRVNTRSLQSSVNVTSLEQAESSSKNNEWGLSSWLPGSKRPKSRFLAFKALPLSTSVSSQSAVGSNNSSSTTGATSSVSETDFVRSICEEIERAMMAGEGAHVETHSVIEESPIISLADAKKRTGYLEYLVYDIKKLVWA